MVAKQARSKLHRTWLEQQQRGNKILSVYSGPLLLHSQPIFGLNVGLGRENDISQADLAFSTSFTQYVSLFAFSWVRFIQTPQPAKRATVTGIEIAHSSQIFLLTTNDDVTAPVLDVGSGDVVVLKNWVPKIELTVEMGRNTIANIESVFTT